ncbi:protein PTCD3 homolog, mitochondrial-like isoform X3 [Hydractinia symbiolongicarpus]|uniref:protein PTCD3 homolog, mitochondrial-like isoform X3 n=1 Tax=Hydractinia symbiolongicarpus TaxID=13093 RepID=UPI0025509DD9|nr:protein PTCD3 homolog, mitochondrial-like isoform X3 [Hydractinia symbiolongicarpus]
MAAVCGELCSCRNLRHFQQTGSIARLSRSIFSSKNVSLQAKEANTEAERTQTYVYGRKKRDRLTVLKALSSTVGQVPNKPDYRFFDDVILNPRSLMKQRELLLAMESGTKAAEYVLKKYPDLFPMRQPVPAWPKESVLIVDDMEETVDNLQLLMTNGDNIPKVINLYEKLKQKELLSIDIHNDVLDFVSFHTVAGSPMESEETKSAKSTWRIDGYAEKLFAELKDQSNSRTYEVFILGLIKHDEQLRAFHLFQEFDNNNMKGSLFFYNSLLSQVCSVREGDKNRWDLVEEIVASMKRSKVTPNVVTYNALLDVAFQMNENAHELCQRLLREMKKLKIAPSLGSYYYVLAAERKRPRQDIKVLVETVRDVKKGCAEFAMQHPADILFFNIAMDLARYKRSGSIARDLLDIVVNNGLQYLLGSKNSSFFGNYICAIARTAPDLDTIIEEYEKIIPKYFIPRDWVFQQLLLALRNHKNAEYVPKLYTDMVSMRVPLTERVTNALYAALDTYVPEEKAEEALRVVKDSRKWMKVFRVPMTSNILSTTIKVLCLNKNYDDARELMEQYKESEIDISYGALKNVLDLNLLQEDKQEALSTLKYMADKKVQLSDEMRKLISDHVLLSDKSEKILSWF